MDGTIVNEELLQVSPLTTDDDFPPLAVLLLMAPPPPPLRFSQF